MSAAPPSRNPTGDNTLVGMISLALKKHTQNTDDMLPARVIAYDRATNRAKVQPLIMMVNTKNERIERGQIASIPVLQLGGGGFVLSFPINTGDLGWIKASDRDLSLFKKEYSASAPNTTRKHSFEDSLFIPDTMMHGVTINGEDSANAVLQNTAGTVRIAIFGNKVKITAPQIVLDSPLTTITGQLVSGTNGAYTQTATFNGTITTTGDVIAQTVSLHGHIHSGVQTGGGSTGVPTP